MKWIRRISLLSFDPYIFCGGSASNTPSETSLSPRDSRSRITTHDRLWRFTFPNSVMPVYRLYKGAPAGVDLKSWAMNLPMSHVWSDSMALIVEAPMARSGADVLGMAVDGCLLVFGSERP